MASMVGHGRPSSAMVSHAPATAKADKVSETVQKLEWNERESDGMPTSTYSLNGNGDGMAFYMLSKLEVRLEGHQSILYEGE